MKSTHVKGLVSNLISDLLFFTYTSEVEMISGKFYSDKKKFNYIIM